MRRAADKPVAQLKNTSSQASFQLPSIGTKRRQEKEEPVRPTEKPDKVTSDYLTAHVPANAATEKRNPRISNFPAKAA